ncbi:unnamed protein product [Didymodactylos carnosus]|uniref:Uncharacterized protein n=1 Tax=Didymodactylos carnosus TaxID=1234261 RepID=A0A8S2HR36_9BILA|nr:unnamed protein product [Didymodactylos carnosus]CAF3677523.1 unnamed protein product [Didymodactylos carnosus]
MNFVLDANLDKSRTVRVLKLIKSIFPQPNLLPTTHHKIPGIFGRTTLFTTNHLCSNCSITVKTSKYGFKHCRFYDATLKNNQETEIVTLDIHSMLHSIVKRNMILLTDHDQLFPDSDIPYFRHYETTTKNQGNTITLLLHADGAPLVRSTKQNL